MAEAATMRVNVRRRIASPRCVFRGGGGTVESCGRAFGLGLPVQPLRAHRKDSRAALWLGPDEWLLIAEDRAAFDALRIALTGRPHALVDVSSRDCVFEIDGPDAALLLNAAVPLDLSEQAFTVGACTRTAFAKTGAMLWRIAPQSFELSVARSFGDYAGLLLDEALRSLPEP